MSEMDNQRIPERPEKSRLMDGYSSSIAEFSRTSQIVNSRMGAMFKGAYERLSNVMGEARLKSENAHQALLTHIADHGC